MTRFARARGSKADNSKAPENPSSWLELKSDITAPPSTEEQSSDSNERVSSTHVQSTSLWAVFDETRDKVVKKKRKEKLETEEETQLATLEDEEAVNGPDELVFGRYITEANKAKLKQLRKELIEKKLPLKEIKKRIEFEKRKMFRAFKKKNCFNCQETGHLITDCPLLKDQSKATVCYTCGSTEHRAFKCKRKNSGNKFAFATCFICKEEGHISTECPDNPCGLYPLGGGCKECGEVTHFTKDCPKLAAKQEKKKVALHVIDPRDLDGLDDDLIKKDSSPPKKKYKIVKF